jgi:hypothetical protein
MLKCDLKLDENKKQYIKTEALKKMVGGIRCFMYKAHRTPRFHSTGFDSPREG